MHRSWGITLAMLCPWFCFGQITIDKPYYARLIVADRDYAQLIRGDVVIDTLIMEDNSSLRFMVPYVSLRVNHAIIRKNVEWLGKGTTRDGKGGSGTPGVHLALEVVFQELGRLLINTSGGSGSNGENGRSGGYNLHGGKGGDGGDGGNIHLRYRCNGFTPIFVDGKKSKAKTETIVFKYQAGSGGLGGGGATRHTVDNNGGIEATGRPGDMGDKGKDGVLTVEEM